MNHEAQISPRPQVNTPLRVFLSYSTKDLVVATAIWERLRAEGHEVYFAEVTMIYGSVIPSELELKIKGCDVFVVLWSKSAKESEWVASEIGLAKGANRESLTVILDRDLQPPVLFSDRKFLPAYQSFHQALEHLSQTASYHAAKKREFEDTQRKQSNLAILGLGALILFAISSD